MICHFVTLEKALMQFAAFLNQHAYDWNISQRAVKCCTIRVITFHIIKQQREG